MLRSLAMAEAVFPIDRHPPECLPSVVLEIIADRPYRIVNSVCLRARPDPKSNRAMSSCSAEPAVRSLAHPRRFCGWFFNDSKKLSQNISRDGPEPDVKNLGGFHQTETWSVFARRRRKLPA